MNPDRLKQQVARHALNYVSDDMVVGVGTGTTVNYFIDALASIKGRIEGVVSSSKATTDRLKAHNIPVYDVNGVDQVHVYIDGADEINSNLQCIKGGGGALTGEKILAAIAERFICIADQSKKVGLLGEFPLPVEVIPMARSYVAREIVKLGGDPIHRHDFITDYGNLILDIHNLEIMEPIKLETQLNNIAGVITNGLFAKRSADILLLAKDSGVEVITK